jgi:hypothetical protein
VQEEWDRVTPEDWKRSIESMRKRCTEVVKARGGSAQYRVNCSTTDSQGYAVSTGSSSFTIDLHSIKYTPLLAGSYLCVIGV